MPDIHVDRELLDCQREHWTGAFDGQTDRFGADPSELAALKAKVGAAGLADVVSVSQQDVCERLPFADRAFDACYSHMLLCMALTTTDDAHYGAGIARGDDMYEAGGFIVHYFSRALVERLAVGCELLEVAEFEEGDLPRRLFRVTLRKSSA